MYHYQPHESYHQPSAYQHYQPYYSHSHGYPKYEYPKYEHKYEPPSYHHQHHHEEEKHGYGHHPSYHKEEEKNGLSTVASLLVPLLGLIGLSLLVPNVVGLRAKRDIGYPGDQQAQVLAGIYNTVLKNDRCIRRLLCEMGQLGKNAKDKDGLFKLIDRMFPKQFHEEVSIFKEASMTETYTCSKYTCQVKPPSSKEKEKEEEPKSKT
uniref:Uncharacterized protein n=1 Tax=Strigamia maritima TaxID=126957 RepID=T1INC8_STRMM